MSKPTWSAEQYAQYAADKIMGWHVEDVTWVDKDDKIVGLRPECFVVGSIVFNPRENWRDAGPVLEALMKSKWLAFPEYSRGTDKQVFMVYDDQRCIEGEGDTILEAIEAFCYELKCREGLDAAKANNEV